MKILVTGSNGFIGKNLIAHLRERKEIELITYDIDDTFDKIEDTIDNVDFIFHLAGVNRPKDKEEFYKGNADFTKALCTLLKDRNIKIPLVITSSIQAMLDNDYGKSKKQAEDSVLEYGLNAPVYVYRLHNIFGKWCRPNYNSVTATFCYNIVNDLEITVNDENAKLELVYIDDIMYEFLGLLDGKLPEEKSGNYYHVGPRYIKTLKEIVDLLYSFKESMHSIYVPSTGQDFVKKLYATYISYMPVSQMVISTKRNVDERGSFIELVRTSETGQFSVSYSKPGVIRGNHYHHTKMERFMVVKGKAKIGFTKIDDGEYYEFFVDDSDIKLVTMPVGYTHNIENIGDDEMILFIWCNELFDSEKPDTCFMEVTNEKA
jgi:UDP-2-acetamido-2,6-beta-L-arabino-hexul-4-ose reductase